MLLLALNNTANAVNNQVNGEPPYLEALFMFVMLCVILLWAAFMLIQIALGTEKEKMQKAKEYHWNE